MAWLCQRLSAPVAKMRSAHRARLGKMRLGIIGCCLRRKAAVENPQLQAQMKKEPMDHRVPLGWGTGREVKVNDLHLWDAGLGCAF